MKKNIIDRSKQCNGDCIYFPKNVSDNVDYNCEDGYCHRLNTPFYTCEYDGHYIWTWEECPYKKTYKDIKLNKFKIKEV